jgi:NAD(P)-dependent dehydrogenase (short-subunit alcohol dehydrogenase family)
MDDGTQHRAPARQPLALITGGSQCLGRALAGALLARGWQVVIDGRRTGLLATTAAALPSSHAVTAVPGDVADPAHRRALADAVDRLAGPDGGLDLLVNNASALGPSPQPELARYPFDVLERVYAVNTLAPLALIQLLLPRIAAGGGRVINISSDAAVEAYPGWGGYGSSKAALDQLTAVLAAELAVEHPAIRVYAVDPGDLNTELHQQAFPGEDISDRPPPESAVPGLLTLVLRSLPSGRYRAADLAEPAGAAGATA